jgi:hypothetical protein
VVAVQDHLGQDRQALSVELAVVVADMVPQVHPVLRRPLSKQ